MICVKNILSEVMTRAGIKEINFLPAWLEEALSRVFQACGEKGFRTLVEESELEERWFGPFFAKCGALRVDGYAKNIRDKGSNENMK
jgi:hypothetical protein